jgi:hypothetical protein
MGDTDPLGDIEKLDPVAAHGIKCMKVIVDSLLPSSPRTHGQHETPLH